VISAAQSRAARGWLNISQQELADISLVNRRTIAEFERGASVPFERTLRDLQRALEERGVRFVFEGQRAAGILDRSVDLVTEQARPPPAESL
jgi:transcriptional regulator with XRE-family HTH domain